MTTSLEKIVYEQNRLNELVEKIINDFKNTNKNTNTNVEKINSYGKDILEKTIKELKELI